MIPHVPEHQQLLTTVWLPAHSHRGIKEYQVSVKCMADLANLHIVQGEGAISASSTDKDLTNTLYSEVGVQGDKLWWKTTEKIMGKSFSLPIYFQSSGCFSDGHQQLIRLLCCGGWRKMIYLLIYQAADDSQKMVTNPLPWTQMFPVKPQPM